MSSDDLWGLAGLVVTGFVGMKAVRHLILRRKARNWPIIVAKVDATDVRMERRSNAQWVHVAEIVYSYEVLGHRYENKWKKSTLFYGTAKRRIDRYPPGQYIPVRFDPRKPQTSVVLRIEQEVPRPSAAGHAGPPLEAEPAPFRMTPSSQPARNRHPLTDGEYEFFAIEHPSGDWQLSAGVDFIQDHITGHYPDYNCIHAPGQYHASREEALACREFGKPGETGR